MIRRASPIMVARLKALRLSCLSIFSVRDISMGTVPNGSMIMKSATVALAKSATKVIGSVKTQPHY